MFTLNDYVSEEELAVVVGGNITSAIAGAALRDLLATLLLPSPFAGDVGGARAGETSVRY